MTRKKQSKTNGNGNGHMPGQPISHIDPGERASLEFQLRTIDRRRAEIEALLAQGQSNTHQAALLDEDYDLASARRSVVGRLTPGPAPDPSVRLRSLHRLRQELKSNQESLEWNAQQAEANGDHRSAQAFRHQMLTLGASLCQQFGWDPALLAEVDP